jgi:general secretion pathway protein K
MTTKRFMTKRGIALISVLWISVLLALIAASFTRTSRTEINLTRNMVENAKAEALADAAINRAALGLFSRPSQGGFRVDGTVYLWRFGDADILFKITDEGGKVDLNAASVDLLRKLLRALGAGPEVSRAVSAAIVDFRDFDDDREQGGAEDRDYQQANLLQNAKDAPFELVAELQQVLGMTPRLYKLIEPLVTVHSGQARPHGKLADPIIQEILNRDAAFAKGESGGESSGESEDEFAREEPSEPTLDGGITIPQGSDAPLALSEDGTNARSPVSIFTIHAEARVEGGGVFARKAILRVGAQRGKAFRVFVWQPTAVVLFPSYDEALANLTAEE